MLSHPKISILGCEQKTLNKKGFQYLDKICQHQFKFLYIIIKENGAFPNIFGLILWAFVDMLLACCLSFMLLSVLSFQNTFRRHPIFLGIFQTFSGTVSHFSQSLIQFLYSLKSLFMGSKYYIWIHHLSICLQKFPLNFWNSKNIFQGLKIISAFSRIVLELKINFQNF